MAGIRLAGDHIYVGSGFSMSFQRTLRVPEGREFPLPPGFGAFPIARVDAGAAGLPGVWRTAPAFAVPLHQQEALWLGFMGTSRSPKALKIAAGGINVLSGTAWEEGLHDTPQDYIVVPDQPWLDGFNAGGTFVRQFVAARLGSGASAEEQLTKGSTGGLQFELYQPDLAKVRSRRREQAREPDVARQALGLGAGGRIRQKVYKDPYGLDVWVRGVTRWVVHLLNTEQFRRRTRRDPGPSPISAQSYVDAGLPWFDLYDEDAASVPASDVLAGLTGVKPTEGARPGGAPDPASLPVRRLRRTAESGTRGKKGAHRNG